MASKRHFWERQAVQGLPLILDEQRGALIIQVAVQWSGWSFRVKAPRRPLGFHAEAQWHLIRGVPMCAIVYTSLPAGIYTIQVPPAAVGATFQVQAGAVTYAVLPSGD